MENNNTIHIQKLKIINDERNQKLKIINDEYDQMIKIIDEEFINANKLFNIGDYIGNVCGIIKVEKIILERYDSGFFAGENNIIYLGKRYYKSKGRLIKTLHNNHKYTKFSQKHNLKLITI